MSITFDGMTDSVRSTDSESRFHISFDPKTVLWSVNGGYIAAALLRACGSVTILPRPANISIQFLRAVAPGDCSIDVASLKKSSGAELLEARLSQGGKLAALAHVWTTDATGGASICLAQMPAAPHPEELKSLDQLRRPNDPPPHPFWDVFDDRPINRTNSWSLRTKVPRAQRWLRYRDIEDLSSPFLRAGMFLPIIDLLGVNAMSNGVGRNALTSVAPTLQLTAHFYQLDAFDGWFLADAHGECARDGLFNNRVGIWSVDGAFVAQGMVQMLSRAREGVYAGGGETAKAGS